MEIRRAKERDIGGVESLLHQVQNVHADGRPDLFKHGGVKYTETELRELFKREDAPVFVCVDEEEQILGYVFCVFSEIAEGETSLKAHKAMFIDDLCVDENCRRQGIGERLYHFAEQEAVKRGCYQLTLHVWECNPGAERFYQRMGLAPLNTTMEKVLGD